MRIRSHRLLIAGAVCTLAVSLWGQKPRSNKEVAAINAINAATTIDGRLAAIDNVLTNFKDTEFKPMLLQMALQLEAQKGDYPAVMSYGQRILDSDPKNANALITMAGETARRIRENDLNKDEQVAKVDKWAKDGIEYAKTAPKPPGTSATDSQWEDQRKDMQAQGWEALAMSAAVRKKSDEAIADYKQSISTAATQDPATWLRLGQVYEDSSKFDEANDAFDKAAASPIANAQIKSVAASKKAEVAKLKASGAKPSGSQ